MCTMNHRNLWNGFPRKNYVFLLQLLSILSYRTPQVNMCVKPNCVLLSVNNHFFHRLLAKLLIKHDSLMDKGKKGMFSSKCSFYASFRNCNQLETDPCCVTAAGFCCSRRTQRVHNIMAIGFFATNFP